MFKSLSLFVIWSILTLSGYGQKYIDLASVSSSYSPSAPFDSLGGSSQTKDIKTSVTVPIKINERVAILTGGAYQHLWINVDPNTGAQFTDGLVKAGVNVKHSETLSGTYMLLPKIASDFEHHSDNTFQLGGIILFKHKRSDYFLIKYGLYADNELFGMFFVPFVGMYYLSPNEMFEVDVTLPVSADANYRFSKYVWAGISFTSSTRSYAYTHFYEQQQYLVKASNDVSAYCQFNFTKSLLFQVKVGHTIGRSFRSYIAGDKMSYAVAPIKVGDNRTQQNIDYADGAFAELKLIYRYHLD